MPGRERVRPIAWERTEVRDSVVRVFFESGVEPCHVLDGVKVDYLANEIQITLLEGSDPDGVNQTCIEILISKAVDVKLDQPVRERLIIDGSD